MLVAQVFAPAFRRNSRWSVTQPVPEVGDDSTSYAEADKFYNFWFSFRSWREFPHPDEEETEQAESREERRCALMQATSVFCCCLHAGHGLEWNGHSLCQIMIGPSVILGGEALHRPGSCAEVLRISMAPQHPPTRLGSSSAEQGTLQALQLVLLLTRVPVTCHRWIERYNAKLREGGKKEEKRRLKEFVEAAYKRDPRILRQREQERAER